MVKKSRKDEKNLNFEELQLLDLRKCSTVSDIVEAMKKCSFGARMLGEVAETLAKMICSRDKSEIPLAIYSGKTDTPLGKLMDIMAAKGWFSRILTPEEYSKEKNKSEKNAVIIGSYSERFEDAMYTKPQRTIFINNSNQFKPGQVRDGYFPDFLNSDPKYAVPVIYFCLLERIEGKKTGIINFMGELRQYGGQASRIADGAETLKAMIDDKACFVFLTLSGAMTVAKMGLVICDMIDTGMVHCIVSTGALIAHGLVESVGLKHYKHNPKYSDALLAEKMLNRVTDTLEPEENLDQVESVLDDVLESFTGEKPISPTELTNAIGKYLSENYPNERGILKSAYEKKVPVLIPAFVDSEIGNDVYTHNRKRMREKKKLIMMDMENDTNVLLKTATAADRIGVFTIGGGVPRNYTQNVAPLIDLLNTRLKMDMNPTMFSYGVRIAPDQMYYGHLSGCTYSEGMSWKKMDPKGRFVEIQGDATQMWPFIVKYVMEKKGMK